MGSFRNKRLCRITTKRLASLVWKLPKTQFKCNKSTLRSFTTLKASNHRFRRPVLWWLNHLWARKSQQSLNRNSIFNNSNNICWTRINQRRSALQTCARTSQLWWIWINPSSSLSRRRPCLANSNNLIRQQVYNSKNSSQLRQCPPSRWSQPHQL